MPKSLRTRFESKYQRGEPDACWLWTGATTPGGYGSVHCPERGAIQVASRVAWELENGPIPDGMMVCHRCDVRRCMNPAHLFLGTNADNMADMRSEGRSPRPGPHFRGSRVPAAKIDEAQAVEILRRLAAGERFYRVASDYPITARSVADTRDRKTWRHVHAA